MDLVQASRASADEKLVETKRPLPRVPAQLIAHALGFAADWFVFDWTCLELVSKEWRAALESTLGQVLYKLAFEARFDRRDAEIAEIKQCSSWKAKLRRRCELDLLMFDGSVSMTSATLYHSFRSLRFGGGYQLRDGELLCNNVGSQHLAMAVFSADTGETLLERAKLAYDDVKLHRRADATADGPRCLTAMSPELDALMRLDAKGAPVGASMPLHPSWHSTRITGHHASARRDLICDSNG